jgi:quinol-cytochrome oxidoreductase complex cytochrome b subunit
MKAQKSFRAGFLEHLHPYALSPETIRFTTTFCLGGSAFFLFAVLLSSGALLSFFYLPTAREAYPSVARLQWVIPFGKWIRGIHYWAGQFMVLAVFLHMVRVFLAKAYAPPRELNWVVGLSLLVFTVLTDFTGYLLRWDQGTYSATLVSLGLIRAIPLWGPSLAQWLMGGPQPGDWTLLRIYVLHVLWLPGLILAGVFYHFWRVRRDGGIKTSL